MPPVACAPWTMNDVDVLAGVERVRAGAADGRPTALSR